MIWLNDRITVEKLRPTEKPRSLEQIEWTIENNILGHSMRLRFHAPILCIFFSDLLESASTVANFTLWLR